MRLIDLDQINIAYRCRDGFFAKLVFQNYADKSDMIYFNTTKWNGWAIHAGCASGEWATSRLDESASGRL